MAKRHLTKADLREKIESLRSERRKNPLKAVAGILRGEIEDHAAEQAQRRPARSFQGEVEQNEKLFAGMNGEQRTLFANFLATSGVTDSMIRAMTPAATKQWLNAFEQRTAELTGESLKKLAEFQSRQAGHPNDPVHTVGALLYNHSTLDEREAE